MGERLYSASVKLTEAVVVGLLRDRMNKPGNGGAGEHAFLAHVRNAAGFDATRTFDAVSMNLWPSRGLGIHIYEVKVSRSDWQRELAKPDKAEDACKIAEQFSIVAPTGCVRDGELPPTWGLIEVAGEGTDDKPWKLRTKVAAPLLREGKPGPLPRGLVVAMLRAAPGAVPGGKNPGPDEQALRAEYQSGYKAGREIAQADVDRAQQQLDELRAIVAEFERAAGVPMRGFRNRQNAAAVGAAVRSVLEGEQRVASVRQQLVDVQQRLRDAATALDRYIEVPA